LNNYLRAFEDPVFMRALRNTLVYVVLVLPTSIVLGLGAALLVHARTRSR
jgi:multiple sugar transport system permease protein